MTPAMIALIILAVCVILFLTEWVPNSIAACMGCVAMVLFHACDFSTAFSGFSNSIVILLVGAMVVGDAMFETGAAQIIGRKVIRWSRGSSRLFLLVGSIVAGVLSMFLANTAVIAAFLPIIDSVCRISPDMRRKDLCLPIACAAMFGGSATLIGCTPQLTANGIMQKLSSVEMGMWDLTGPGVCLLVLFVVYTQFIGYRRGDKIWGDRPEEAMELEEERVNSVLNQVYDKKKLVTIFAIAVLMIAFYVGAWISTTMTAVCAALLCVFTRCCDPKKVITNLNWDCIIFLAACLSLADALTASGAGDLIAGIVTGLMGDIQSPVIVFAILVLLTLVISQFITNSTAIIITLPIALSMCATYGFNPMAFCLGVTFAASVACCTPLAAAQITMTQVAGYKFFDYFHYTWPLTVLSYIGILVFVPLFCPLVG